MHHNLKNPKEFYISKGLSGIITNETNKCFLISILHCLSNTYTFTDILTQPGYTRVITDENLIVSSYKKLLHKTWESNQLVKADSLFNLLYKHKTFEKYKTHRQEDSHEFLTMFLDILYQGTKTKIDVEITGEIITESDKLTKMYMEAWKSYYKNNYSDLIEVFNGMNLNTVKCNNCDYISRSFAPYTSLSLTVEDTLSKSLDKYFKTERLDMTCEKCNKQECSSDLSNWCFGNYMVLHFSRFKEIGNRYIKNKSLVTVDLENIDLTKYICKSKNDPNNYIYSVYAINYHSGDIDSGHYWSSCKNLDGNWYSCNQGNVSKTNKKTLLNQDIYMLFLYRKFI
jgi:ubiquitin C-terminal hydrolase